MAGQMVPRYEKFLVPRGRGLTEIPKLQKYESLCFHLCFYIRKDKGAGKDRESLHPP